MKNQNDEFSATDWVVFISVATITALLVGSSCRGDEVESARQRLRQIAAEKQQAGEVAAAKAAQENAAVAEQFAASLDPVPDPISAQAAPTISFAHAVGAIGNAERLPRAVLVVSQYCSPCQRIEKECADLIGGSTAPIQIVHNWLANDLDEWGVTPGMQQGTPYLFVLGKDGKVHGLTPGGLGCRLMGYQSREAILSYLAQPDHAVSIVARDEPPVIATVEGAAASPDTFAAVLAAHLAESSGQQKDQEHAYGGLFDFTVDVPEAWKTIGVKLLTAQKIKFASAGVTVDWTGTPRTFNVSKSSITITPAVKVTLKKWFISYTAALDGVQFSADLSTVTVLLTGAPDLTIQLK